MIRHWGEYLTVEYLGCGMMRTNYWDISLTYCMDSMNGRYLHVCCSLWDLPLIVLSATPSLKKMSPRNATITGDGGSILGKICRLRNSWLVTAGEGGRGVWKSLKGITWFSAETEGDQSLSTEYKGGGTMENLLLINYKWGGGGWVTRGS